jgi:hypothetical protein
MMGDGFIVADRILTVKFCVEKEPHNATMLSK